MLIFVPQPRLVAGLQAKGELGQSFFAMLFVLFSWSANAKRTPVFDDLFSETVGLGLGLVLCARGAASSAHKCRVGDGIGVIGLGLEGQSQS